MAYETAVMAPVHGPTRLVIGTPLPHLATAPVGDGASGTRRSSDTKGSPWGAGTTFRSSSKRSRGRRPDAGAAATAGATLRIP